MSFWWRFHSDRQNPHPNVEGYVTSIDRMESRKLNKINNEKINFNSSYLAYKRNGFSIK